jgi:HEPN domain-containing protein
VDRKGLQDLSKIRLKEANALLRLGLFDGAYYLAGYAVECALKACIAKGTRRGEFPERKKVESSHSHNLLQLITVAKLDGVRKEYAGQNPAFWNNWDVVERWSEQCRYERKSEEAARELLAAVGDPRHGVITWIKQQW